MELKCPTWHYFTRFLPSSFGPYWKETGSAILFWRPVSPPPTPLDFQSTQKAGVFFVVSPRLLVC